MTFEQMLPRLVTAYDRGILVPFLGAGMSVDLCPDWQKLIQAIEQGRTGTDLGGRSPSPCPELQPLLPSRDRRPPVIKHLGGHPKPPRISGLH